jgi:integrase
VLAAGDSKHSIEFLVREFTERFLQRNRKRPQYAVRQLERDVLPEWKGRDARSIKHREVVEVLDKIVDRGKPVMANRTAALLGQLFKFGVQRGIVESTPVLPYRPGGKEKARERVLSDEELAAFLRDPAACTRHERLVRGIRLLLLTGQRRGELAAAKWREIDFDAGTWTIPDENSKAGKGHVLPLSRWAVEEFRALKAAAGKSQWVLPAASDSKTHVDALWLTRRLAKDAERFEKQQIAEFTLHDLRRTLRTGLSKLSVAPHVAERVLGHKQRGIIGVYDRHAYLDEQRAALDKWAMHLATLRDQPPQPPRAS